MTDQADRAGADGRRQIIENCIKVVALEMYPDPVMTDDFYHNRKCQTAIEGLNAVLDTIRAAPPSGNAGERAEPVAVCATCSGVGLVGGFVAPESGYQDEPCPDCKPAPCHPAAPPQPAPDAMRTRPTADDIRAAVENLGYDLKLREFAPRTEIGIRNFNERCEALAAAISTAPVPSGEGSGERVGRLPESPCR